MALIYTQRVWHPRSRYDCNYKVRCVETLKSGILGIIQRENTAWRKDPNRRRCGLLGA